MKRSFKERIRDWLMDNPYGADIAIENDHHSNNIDSDNSINFNVINASGGRIVQVRYYDPRADRHKNSLHIVTPDENLAEALAHILTLETLGK